MATIAVKANDSIKLPQLSRYGAGGEYILDSVESYAIRNGHDAQEWIARAERKGDRLHFATPKPAVIGLHHIPREEGSVLHEIEWSDTLIFDGIPFGIVETSNSNVELVKI